MKSQANSSILDPPVTKIQPSGGWTGLRLREVWEYRDLLYFLTWRDVKVRYKQTVLGAAWAILQPFLTMLIFSLFFGRLAKVPSDGIPYPLFAYAALVPWSFFANALAQSGNCLVGNSHLIKKVFFPRLIIPLSSTLAGLVDFLLAFGVLLAMMGYYGIGLHTRMVWIPLYLALALAAALGVGLWLAALNVYYRDVRYALPFLIQAWMFVSPIAYPSSLLPETWRVLYGLNPLAGVVDGFRFGLGLTGQAPHGMILVSSLAALSLLIGGAFYFRRMEKSFADVI